MTYVSFIVSSSKSPFVVTLYTEGIINAFGSISPQGPARSCAVCYEGFVILFGEPFGNRHSFMDMLCDPLDHGWLDRLIGNLIVDDHVRRPSNEASAADFRITALFVDLRFYAVQLR